MANAYARGWGNPGRPGTNEAAAYRSAHIERVTAGGITLYVRREVAHLFIGLCDDLVAAGYPLNVKADDWGYNNRNIRGYPDSDTNLDHKSNHSWGLAVDLNSADNPMTSDGRNHTDMPVDVVRRLAAKWHLQWGGDYTGSRHDPMHFEFVGTPGDVPQSANLEATGPAVVLNTSQEDDTLYVFTTDPNHSQAQVLAIGGNLFVIPDWADSVDLRDAGAKFVKLEAGLFDKLLAAAA